MGFCNSTDQPGFQQADVTPHPSCLLVGISFDGGRDFGAGSSSPRRVSADLVQRLTARVVRSAHMVRIPVETKSHPFWQKDPFDGHNERFPWNLVSFLQVRSREHLVPPTAIRAAAFLVSP